MDKKNKKEELIEELEELALKCELKEKLRKEKMFFKHTFINYFSSKIQIFISFLISLCGFITYELITSNNQIIYQMGIVFLSSLIINSCISCFRCSRNQEIQKYYRTISFKLFLQILLFLIFFFAFILFI